VEQVSINQIQTIIQVMPNQANKKGFKKRNGSDISLSISKQMMSYIKAQFPYFRR